MSYYCPVCNGMEQLNAGCPDCGGPADDHGRINDYFDPYSPYRPIDDINRTNGYADLARHACVHVLYCPACGETFSLYVQQAWG